MAATISVDLNARIAQFETEMKKATGTLDRFSGKSKNLGETLGRNIGLGVAAVAVGFGAFAKSTLDAADNLKDMSARLGVSVKDLASFKLIADQSGTSLEGVGVGIARLTRSIGEAEAGNEKISESLRALGITSRDPKEAFFQLADAVKRIEDPSRRAALLSAVLGKSYQDLVPLLSEGGGALRSSAKESESFADAMARLAPHADQFNDNLAKLKLNLATLTGGLLQSVVPLINDIAEAMRNATDFGDGFLGLFAALQNSGVSDGDIGQQIDKVSGRLKILRADLDELSKPGLINQVNDFVFGDVHDLQAQISVAEKELALLTKRREALVPKPPKPKPKPTIDLPSKSAKEPFDVLSNIGKDLYKETAVIEARNKALERTQFIIDDLKQRYALQNSAALDGMNIISAAQHKLSADLSKVGEEGRKATEDPSKSDYLKTFGADVYASALKKISDATEAQRKLAIELAAEQERLNGLWQYGAATALQGYIDDVANVAKSTESLVAKAFGGMEDALVNFVRTGKLDFKSLADSIISDLIRIQIRQSISSALPSLSSGFLGNLFGGIGFGDKAGLAAGVPRFALCGVQSGAGISAFSGQVVSRPTLFPFASGVGLMGEAGAEAILPLRRGADGKLGVSGGGGAGGGLVVNIIESPGKGGQTQQRNSGGVNILDVFVEQVKSSIASDISRGSGAVPAAMSQTFGLNRAAGAY